MGEDAYACPRRPLLDDPEFFGEVFEAFGHYRAGFLPEAGTVEDQSDVLMTLVRQCEVVTSQIEEFRLEQGRKK